MDHFLLFMAKEMSIYTPNITLSIPHVPKMFYNLLSVHKVLKKDNYVVIFYPNYYVFRNQILRKMIGNAKKRRMTFTI